MLFGRLFCNNDSLTQLSFAVHRLPHHGVG